MKTEFGKTTLSELTDSYETAILHKDVLHVTWMDSGMVRESRLYPRDLQAHSGKEFLIAKDDQGNSLEICLEQVKSVREFTGVAPPAPAE